MYTVWGATAPSYQMSPFKKVHCPNQKVRQQSDTTVNSINDGKPPAFKMTLVHMGKPSH